MNLNHAVGTFCEPLYSGGLLTLLFVAAPLLFAWGNGWLDAWKGKAMASTGIDNVILIVSAIVTGIFVSLVIAPLWATFLDGSGAVAKDAGAIATVHLSPQGFGWATLFSVLWYCAQKYLYSCGFDFKRSRDEKRLIAAGNETSVSQGM